MATLPETIAEKFLKKLAERPEFDKPTLAALAKAIGGGKKVKADGLVKIFSNPVSEDIK